MGTVLGVVTVQGEVPADGLQLSLFNPMTGRGARSKTEKDGSFRMNRPLPVGNYKMLIDQMVPEEPEPDNKPDSNKMQIDSAYANDQTTPLEFEVVRGENTLQIDLKGPSARKSSSR